MRIALTTALLIGSNCFMTWAWYGHLKKTGWTIPTAIVISWLIALPEYILQVPANRIGHVDHGGPLSASQLKVLQEAITLTVFTCFAIFVLKERPRVQDYVAFGLILAGVAVAMSGRRDPAARAPDAAAPMPALEAAPAEPPADPAASR
ncbi:MAG: hypothetical protein C0475_01180 [Planctomyces sp.]|nr:hypothetical protein [Planctomyces sp.]